MLFKLIRYQIIDLISSRWFIFQFLFFAISSYILFNISGSFERAILSIVILSLIFLPLFSILLSLSYVYSSRNFIEFILIYPVKRKTIYLSFFLSLSSFIFITYMLGILISAIISASFNINLFRYLFSSSIILFPFITIGILISTLSEDRLKGTIILFFIYLIFTVIYDAIALYLLIILSDWPIESLFTFIILLNPLDAIRIITLLSLNLSDIFAFTGDFLLRYKHFYFFPFILCLFYTLLFLILGIRKFERRDF